MARDYPAFLFYPEDFVAGTAAMPPLAVGVYIRCLCHQWHRGFVPDDMPSIARLSGATLEEVAAVWPAVSEKFSKVKAGYQNRRLEEERGKLKRRTKSGKKAAQSRWEGGCDSNAIDDANSMRIECESDRSRVANANANANASEIELPSKAGRAFVRPTLAEVTAYCLERGKGVNPQKWFDHYDSNGWKVGRNSMKDWKAAVRKWRTTNMETASQQNITAATSQDQDSDFKDEQALKDFIAENRHYLPPAPAKASFDHLSLSPESVARAEERIREQEHRARRRQRSELSNRLMDLIAAAGNRYLGCTLDGFQCTIPQQHKVVDALIDYIEEDCRDNVILYGPVGTGKDHLAFAVCKSAIKSGRTVKWVNGQSWFGIVRDAMETDKSEAALIAELARPDLLCLSDPLPPVGALTQFQATMLYRLVDGRYSRGLPTICTINVGSTAEADERMGAATWDRLTHGAWKLFCNWPTYRTPTRDV